MTSALAAAFLATTLGFAFLWLRVRQRLSDSGLNQRAAERASRLIEEERQVLHLIAKGASLKEVLDALTAAIQRMAPGCFCSILLLEGRHLREGSGGSLPA